MNIIMVNVHELQQHPKQHDFFSDIDGEEWFDFVDSIRETNGPVVPITITENNVIVSGHQRVRACIANGIYEVKAEVVDYGGDELRIVKDLIEINVKQRGTIESTEKQMVARVNALKEYYGMKAGRPNADNSSQVGRISEIADNSSQVGRISETQLYERAGASKSSYYRAKALEKLIPEWKTAFDKERISTSNAANIIAPLSEDEQRKLYDAVPRRGKVSYSTLISTLSDIRNKAGLSETQGHEEPATEAKSELQTTKEPAAEVKSEPQTETGPIAMENSESQSRYDEREGELSDDYDLCNEAWHRIHKLESYFERIYIHQNMELKRLSDKEKQQLRIQFDNLTQLFKMTIMGEEIVD